ncbi:MAG: phosphotransferase [Planctomycetota bacterium]
MIESLAAKLLDDSVRSRWTDTLPKKLHFMRVGTREVVENEGTVTLVVFPDNGPAQLVARIGKAACYDSLVEELHRVIEHLSSAVTGPSASGLARPVMLDRIEGQLVSVYTFLPGRQLLGWVTEGGPLHRRRVRRELHGAARWLAQFYHDTASLRREVPAGEYLLDMHHRVASDYGGTDALSALFDRLVDRYGGDTLELGPAHGDYGPANLLWHRGRVAPIDWVQYGDLAPVGSDLVNLLTARKVDREDGAVDESADIYRMARRGHWYGTLAERVLNRHVTAAGDPQLTMVLGLAYFANRPVAEIGCRPEPCLRRAELLKDYASFCMSGATSVVPARLAHWIE